MKDPYREIAEQHKQPLEKINEFALAEGETLQRPVKEKSEKRNHFPLITALLVFFIASPFLVVYTLKEEKPVGNQTVHEQPDDKPHEAAQNE